MNSSFLRNKRPVVLAVLGGVLVVLLTGFITFSVLYAQAGERSNNLIEYIKAQSLVYDSYNDASTTKSQLRAMECSEQLARNINERNGDVSEKALANDISDLSLTAAFVLTPEGKLVSQSSKDQVSFASVGESATEKAALDVASHPKKDYVTRVVLEDGSFVDLSCSARIDSPGVVVAAYHTALEYANRYQLSLQSLLEGYELGDGTSIVVENEGKVVASNTDHDPDTVDHITPADAAVVDAIRDRGAIDETHLVSSDGGQYYGSYGKARNYYVYSFSRAGALFHYVASNSVLMLSLYLMVVGLFVYQRRRAAHRHLTELVSQEHQYAEQLEQAAQEAKQANLAKTEFLQRMSHDIRTPINGIQGMVEVGNAYADDAQKQAECREKIKTASDLLLDLVNEVLDMSKLESNEVDFDIKPTNLKALIVETCEMLERQAQERHISIEEDLSEINHVCVMASSLHLRRIVMNIASNAVKYNKFGGTVTLTCKEISYEEGKATYEIKVADTGIGMSEEFQKRLFEPFAREMQENDYQPSGTGLGMAITKQLIEIMGGTISCESALGVGTTYTITLPFDVAEQDDDRECAASKADVSLEGLRILLVEDNDLNREIAEFVIDEAGAMFTSVATGEEALEAFKESVPGTFAVILMDIMMPGMNGYETTKAIRSLSRTDAKTVPIIAMSANAFADDKRRSREAGMDAHIAKPFNFDELVQTISSLA